MLTSLNTVHSKAAFVFFFKRKSEEESVVVCLFERKLQFKFRSAAQFLNWLPVFFIGATKLLAVNLGWARQGRP